ncbi:MAG: hypothetical protein ACM3Q1_05255 [Bacteroidales bacterium]
MLIDTDDAVTLSHLNPLERQVLRGLADRLAMLAWQRVGWQGEAGPIPAPEPAADIVPLTAR